MNVIHKKAACVLWVSMGIIIISYFACLQNTTHLPAHRIPSETEETSLLAFPEESKLNLTPMSFAEHDPPTMYITTTSISFMTPVETILDEKRQIRHIASYTSSPPYNYRAWDGHNPFHQPAATTDYYGSGDVDCDGSVDTHDAVLVNKMKDGLVRQNARADVDGDGDVDDADGVLVGDAVSGNTLPGWWNDLGSRTEREHWVKHILALDHTDAHPYGDLWLCFNYAAQLFTHSAFYRGDLSHTNYNGGQTLYNIPLYLVSVRGHVMNGVLVGDDPLNFDDWWFIDPQTDLTTSPGKSNMPYGYVRIEVPNEMYTVKYTADVIVTFTVSSTGWTLESYDPALLLQRPTPSMQRPDNRVDLWNPRVIPGNPDLVLFERYSNDLTRNVNIHMATLPFIDQPDSYALPLLTEGNRLLDISQDDNGTLHLLWKAEEAYTPGIFYGKLYPSTGIVTGTQRISVEPQIPLMGRVVTAPNEVIHAFWLVGKSNTHQQLLPGVYWSRSIRTNWETAQNLTPDTYHFLYEFQGWGNHKSILYFFDADIWEGKIILTWVERLGVAKDETLLRYRFYDGAWGQPATIETGNVRGLDITSGTDGILHLTYWLGKSSLYEESRGILLHRTFNGTEWSEPFVVDQSKNAGFPRMAAGENGEIYMVWERKNNDCVVPVWSTFSDGVWGDLHFLDVKQGTQAWYPNVNKMSADALFITWSSRSDESVTIENRIIALPRTE